jgi:hypothetical protein
MKYSIGVLIGSALLLAFSAASADDAFRCGQHNIKLGDSREHVLEHCGKPASESGWTWTYDRGSEELSVVVHFEADGTVNRIEEGDGI